jgi:hypothetical protein
VVAEIALAPGWSPSQSSHSSAWSRASASADLINQAFQPDCADDVGLESLTYAFGSY